MSIKKLLNFSNGFYFLSALVFFAVVGVAGLHLKSTITQLDEHVVYLNNIDNIYAQSLQKGQSTRNIL
jgi:methyl-accepting chemotaxis protein